MCYFFSNFVLKIKKHPSNIEPKTVNRPWCRFLIKEQELSSACMASYQSYFLNVARYARGNKTANLLNNQTKSGKESIDCFELKRQA